MTEKFRALTLVLFGTVLGVGLVVACSDDSPSDADAAACDCPAAEPPLTGRISKRTASMTLAPNTNGGTGADCLAGEILLGGGCSGAGTGVLTLAQSGILAGADIVQGGFTCDWRSTSTTPIEVTATAICLRTTP